MRLTSRLRNVLLTAVAAVSLAVAAPVSTAGATLVYERDFRTSNPTVWVARDDGTGAHRLAFGGGPGISPDGRLVAYMSGGALMLVRATGGRARVLLRGDVGPLGFSPTGKQLAAILQIPTTRTNPGSDTFITIDLGRGRVHRIATAGVPELWQMGFSPDGTQVTYTGVPSANVTRYDIYRAPATGGRPVRLTYGGASMWSVWGPSWIAFMRQGAPSPLDRIPKENLYLIKPTGKGLRRLTHVTIGKDQFGFVPLAWSANGRRLIAEFRGIGFSYIVTVDPRTGAVNYVGRPTAGNRGISGAGLSRDGTTILGVRQDATGSIDTVVCLPYQGGQPRVLARNAIDPSWSR